ncbi:MAG: GNAT family N-acetyltransferase [Candidatus Bipolaricaulia bacterium]
MSSDQRKGLSIVVPDAPDIAGLSFRSFRGESDYPLMLVVLNFCKVADKDEWSPSMDDITRDYRHLRNCDPSTDMIFTEMDEQLVGYGRTWWEDERRGDRIFSLFTNLVPDWRAKGIRRAMLRWLEARAREVSDGNPTEGAEFLQSWASEHEHDARHLYESAGYETVRWDYEMVRSLAEEIAPAPLPKGIEVRPVTDADAPQIFAAASEAFADHWGETNWFTEKDLVEWRESPTYSPELWKVAWDGDQVVGTVLNFVNKKENEEYKRERGYTESICVLKPWRGKGIAKALITESMKMHRANGMTETAHGVDTQNPTGALQLYEGLGYRPNKTFYSLRKPLKP